ncbi:MAG: hypothetical protein ACYCYK_02475 [Candidatus Dormibacteria bacterium]
MDIGRPLLLTKHQLDNSVIHAPTPAAAVPARAHPILATPPEQLQLVGRQLPPCRDFWELALTAGPAPAAISTPVPTGSQSASLGLPRGHLPPAVPLLGTEATYSWLPTSGSRPWPPSGLTTYTRSGPSETGAGPRG